MEKTPNSERLYRIQMSLKRNKVNQRRKRAEVKRIQKTYEAQVQTYIYQLYVSALHIWEHINNTDDVSSETYLQNIKPQPTESEINEEISSTLAKIKDNPKQFIDSLSSTTHLERDDFIFLLSLFNFFWSKESIDLFLRFVTQVEGIIETGLSQCFLVFPCVQIYFISALKPVFENFGGSDDNLQFLLDSLLKYSSLIPSYLKDYIQMNQNKSALLCNSFLKPFIEHFTLFGISDPELYLFCSKELSSLLSQIEQYFNTTESQTFVEKLISNSKSIIVTPQETKLFEIYSHYTPTTLIDSSTLPKFGVPQTKSPLSYIPLSSTVPTTATSDSQRNAPTLTYYARKFLLETEIIHLEKEFPNAYEYFRQLIDLSSMDISIELESTFDQLVILLNSSHATINNICKMIEDELKVEEENQSEDPLIEIASYSSQFSYLNRIIEFNKLIAENSENETNFIMIQKALPNFLVENPPPENPYETKNFVEYFTNALNALQKINPNIKMNVTTNKNLHSLLVHQLRISQWINENKEIQEEERKMHKFLDEKRDELIDCHHLDFLEKYKINPQKKLKYFFEEFDKAFKCKMLFVRLDHIHAAYDVLTGLLQEAGIGEIGADQIVPFAILATVYANPEELTSTYVFLSRFVEPLLLVNSVVPHSHEYSLIQFLSSYQFLKEKLEEEEKKENN
ncbi:hypothetical protein GPJ56_009012 [Histomonas meleagridis]|uniref:uncharacterized protein n=1 Tax=Histomonas meleagridis TaxID=135588 RepID=UPI003559AAB6|nr:hypothetical protein GPJ56_009012 [Histomonas meleagridis]KAH0799333.1 hypothetical protein GO595_008130 [Histomonas meleagridis]